MAITQGRVVLENSRIYQICMNGGTMVRLSLQTACLGEKSGFRLRGGTELWSGSVEARVAERLSGATAARLERTW